MRTSTQAGRGFWRDVLEAGAFTPIPRWTNDPLQGVAEYELPIPGDVVAQLRGLSDELTVPLSSVLLAAHAKVLAALCGEREVESGYVAMEGGPPLPCRLTTEPTPGGPCAARPSNRVGRTCVQRLPRR